MADTLEDFRSALEETEYGSFLQDEPAPLAVTTIGNKARQKFVAEFQYIRSQANRPLGRFLDFITYEKMIDNVVNLIQGCMNQKSTEELIARVDQLGWIPELKAITVMDFSLGFDEVYRTLLVETPIGPYFQYYIQVQTHADDSSKADVGSIIREADLELMRNILKKAWLEDFYAFCETLDPTSFEVMENILKVEADFRVVAVTLNSIGTSLGEAAQLQDRNALYPGFGYLYPEGVEKMRRAWNDATLRTALDSYPYYSNLYEQCRSYYTNVDDSNAAADDGGARRLQAATTTTSLKSFEDLVFEQLVKMYEDTFERTMHYGLFYGLVKLKEQEIRNIVWIADMITMKKKEQVDRILPLFQLR
eukprot:GHVO01052768.1.p1 GENE.GHVO01052768.1~~GHVO01052768.1.p1  ORF type:complete len:373 (-),score=60.66 GHVO01052768.1:64-1152(-)